MALRTGTRLGSYEIIAPIGAGGMGEVYLARDAKLGRDVAIKVLPEEFSQSEERLRRFEREARLLASLNHPNIAAVYGFEESENVHYLALELVPGETLSERLARGRLPVEEVLGIALQICKALEEAHERGVVHRDLKPANVKLTEDGKVKVLDFGLAKVFSEEVGEVDSSLSPTLTRDATRAGVIMGTAAYMSPEQARGRVVDKRSDIFSFGSLLYEMLAGRKAFPGDDVSEILAAVIKTEPEQRALPDDSDPRLRRLLERCLKKEPRERLRDIGDALLEIDEIRKGPATEASGTAPVPAWRRVRPWAIAAIAAMAAVGSWFWSEPPSTRPAHMQISLPAGVLLAVDTEHPTLALSPDGTHLVFVGEQEGVRRLYLRDLAAPEALVIAGTEEAASPFFSPDGQWVGFLTEGSLKKVSVEGGVPVAIHGSTGPAVNSGTTWGVGDTVIWSPSANEALARASLAGDSLRPFDEWEYITDVGSATAWPHALPDGNYVAYVDTSQGSPDEAVVLALDLETLETKTIFRGGTNPRYSPTKHLLFARHGSLYALPFDSTRAEVTGVEKKLLDGVMSSRNGAAQFAVGGNGTLAYVTGDADLGDDELIWVGRKGTIEPILDASHLSEPRLSPDGTQLLVTSRTGANIDLWLLDLERTTFTRLTSDPGEDLGGLWSPDGMRLALASEIKAEGGGPTLAWMPSLNAAPEVLVESEAPGDWEFVSSWSPDGQWLLYTTVRGALQRDIWLFPIESDAAEPVPFLDSPASEHDGTFSPDGRWVAYVSNVSGRDEVYLTSFSEPGVQVVQISTRGGSQPRWSRDGRELFYLKGDQLMVVRTGTGGTMEPTKPEVLFEGRFGRTYGDAGVTYDVSLDGSRFVMVRTKNLVMPTVIHVVLNWPAALSADVPEER